MKELTKKLYTTLGLVVMLVVCATGIASAQSEATNFYVKNVKNQALDQHKKSMMVPLSKVLEKVGHARHITFVYESDLIEGKTVSKTVLTSANLAQKLGKLLLNNGLTYEKQGKSTYVIKRLPMFGGMRPAAAAQITGTVTDGSSGETLPGVNIKVKGTTTGTATDTQGQYELSVESLQDTLVFSFVGYQTRQVPINGRTEINIKMKTQAISGQEMVVVGYGEKKEEDITGSISHVDLNNEVTASRTLTNTSSALAGLTSGTFVRQESGLPRSNGATISIRGIGSLNASRQPLVIIDGMPGNINNVDPESIESISILKDAASAAIYGSRASNGVILIKTKSGSKSGKVTFNYSGYMGMSKPTKGPNPISNTAHHMELINLVRKNSGRSIVYTQDQINEWKQKSKTDPLDYPNTNWWKAIIKPNKVWKHNLSASGGNDNIQFYTSLNYLNNNGLVPNSGFEKYNFINNLDYKINDWLKFHTNLRVLSGDAEPLSVGNVFNFWAGTTPGMVPKHNGKYGSAQTPALEFQSANPLRSAENPVGERKRRNYNGKLSGIVTPLKGLKITGSYFINRSDDHGWRSSHQYDRYNFRTGTKTKNYNPANKSLSTYYNRSEKQVYHLTAEFDKSLGSHNFQLLAGYSQNYNKYGSTNASKSGLLSLNTPVLNAASRNPNVSQDATDFALRSYFGRIDYKYENKYILQGNLRYDGSSRFAPDNRWGTFPSISLGWRISSESFWKRIKKAINNFKLRVSWGKLGNNNIGNYEWQNFYTRVNYSFNSSVADGLAYNKIVNRDITWETTKIVDVGANIGLFHKLSVTLDYYDKDTDGVLANTPIPLVNGALTPPRTNLAEVENSGYEAGLKYRTNISDDFSISLAANGSYNKNRIVSYKGDYIEPHGIGAWTEGHPINNFYVREVDHIIRDQSTIDNLIKDGWTFDSTPGVGDLLYKDTNGDKIINSKDRVLKGNPIPLYTYNANLRLNYKGFDFFMLIDGVAKWDKYLHSQMRTLDHNAFNYLYPRAYYNATWTKDNPDASIPKIYSGNNQNDRTSDFFLHNADYLKIKTIQLGYTIPQDLTTEVEISKVRAFINLENYFEFTSYPGMDPEASAGTGGANTAQYPLMKTISFGINVDF